MAEGRAVVAAVGRAPDDAAGRVYDVFLSYAHLDAEHDVANARTIGQWLESLGYTVWWDRGLVPGDSWPKVLVAKVEAAKRMIVLWSANADKSQWVHTETALAFAKDKLVPLALDDHPFPEHWSAIQHDRPKTFEAQQEIILRVLGIRPEGRPPEALPPQSPDRVRIAALPTGTGQLIGRKTEIDRLHLAWHSTAPSEDIKRKTNVAVLHAIGGAGKTALMRRFVDDLAAENFFGAHKVYGWSAYSQGSGDNKQVDSDSFIHDALKFFGHDVDAHPIKDAVERGRTLARLVRERRCLFVLDGLEPLQDPAHINGGRLKDRAVAVLITELAADNRGLLLITSRQPLPELANIAEPRVVSHPLNELSEAEGVKLLEHLGVHGRRSDLAASVRELAGHALSLTLLGTWLDAIHGGDIAAREQLNLSDIIDEPADFIGDETKRFARRAARILEGYVARFAGLEGEASPISPEIAVLSITGLFDRLATQDAIDVLLAEPVIPGLTDAFAGLSPQRRAARLQVALERLRQSKLLNAEVSLTPNDWDAHPLVRDFFGKRLKGQTPEAFRAAHSRLYDFYRYQGLPPEFCTPAAYGLLALIGAFPQLGDQIGAAITERRWPEGWHDVLPKDLLEPDWTRLGAAAKLVGTVAFADALARFQPETLDGMTPQFHAIFHGCAAGQHADTYAEIYRPRVQRGNEAFIILKLGQLGANLAVLANFFDEPWSLPTAGLPANTQSLVLNFAGFALRALGGLRDATEPFQANLELRKKQEAWLSAGIAASNLSELLQTLGDIGPAIAAATESVAHADRSGDAFERLSDRTTHADVLHQAGRIVAAAALFAEAVAMQSKRQPTLPKLYSLQGAQYCDLLLASGAVAEVQERAAQTLEWSNAAMRSGGGGSLLDIALDTLSLGRAAHALWRRGRGIPPSTPSSSGERAAGASKPGESAQESAEPHDRAFGTYFAGSPPSLAEARDGEDDGWKVDAATHLDAAVEGLRRAGMEDHLPRGLLARAAFRRDCGDYQAAATDLAEAAEIAERGEMRLFQVDGYLESARLILTCLDGVADTERATLRHNAEQVIAAAAALIDATGYFRRNPEVKALHLALDGVIPVTHLGPDLDPDGAPAGLWIEKNLPQL